MAHDPFYDSPAWRTLRRQFIAEHPECSVMGCGKRSSHVDHIVARRRGGASLDPANLQALCHSCHSRKTAQRDGAFGNPTRMKGCDASGRPLDPQHRWNG